MRKLVLVAALLLTAMTMAFAGPSKDTSGATSGAVTLTVYHQIDLASPQYEYWPVTLAAFAEKYPDIKLDFEYVSGEQFHDKFQAMAATGDIPDIFTTYVGSRSSYILDRGLVKDLRPYLTDSFKANYTPAIWGPQGPNGEIYIISPNMAVCTVVYVNTKLQKELGLTTPKTLDEMIAQVPAIRAAGYTPLMFANKGVWQAQSLLLSMLVDRMGGTAWFDKARAGTAKFTDKPFVDALAVIKRMVDTQLFPAGVNQLEGPEGWGDFVQGKSVYLLDAGWRVGALKGAAAPADYAQYEAIAFPEVPGEVVHGSSAATLGEALAMNAKLTGAKADAAWKFLSFIYGQEGLDILMKYGTVPTYKLDYSKYDLDSLNRQYIQLTNSQTMGYVIDAVMDGEGVNNLLNPGIQAVMMGSKTPAQLAAEYEAWVAANDSNRKK
ncbi:putative bacterial extracellular solute-binding protein [Treponema primitia ZAS-2]|uniref:Putative bacterial extracellular solute-binding protein n=1 Tax=Treponema primitia (strain ATCC BAA-887 / DSM 12427 / ZAS-2) TaxID=545694 RepID=F5YQ57_TREPZ|nr:extracellular solute-binding protein [Treponema primitia]AEF84862.1 putative bacterial extracellular solute-binding protein [Treponema primitia ZAS-2]